MGWFLSSPGTEFDRNKMDSNFASDYEGLCRMDVLGLADAAEYDQGAVHAEFKEQLHRYKEGWYGTGLPWRANHPELPDKKHGSLLRLNKREKNLHRKDLTAEFHNVMQDQIVEGIVEKAPIEASGQQFYLPQKPVARETASTTKLMMMMMMI